MQALFAAVARILVRELRKTEATDIIMVYSSTMHLVVPLSLHIFKCLLSPQARCPHSRMLNQIGS